MDMQQAINVALKNRDLSRDEMTSVMSTIMTGEATPAQIGGFLVGLHAKGESVVEIAAAASVMRELSTRVDIEHPHLVDTCGTGGDSSGTFNISTAAAFVAAGAGAKVAKHGNKSVSSTSGSADVLEAAGVNLGLTPEQVRHCIDTAGVGFMFAPAHHGAMKHAIGPRREMGVRTIFNVLGPLTNPAGALNQVIGVFSDELVEPLAHVLKELGSRHVMVVHARDGLDEISIAAETNVAELKDGVVSSYTLSPAEAGATMDSLESLKVSSAEDSLRMIESVLDGQAGPALEIVALNAGAAVYTSGLASDLNDGVARAREAIASGAAKQALSMLVATSKED
ncbi:MAG: anthranilate phosphoribosyltransferase [Thiotrichales bacterium]|nr:anthranilate phosphoribosyltransferase [Thiotrichales bacterium]